LALTPAGSKGVSPRFRAIDSSVTALRRRALLRVKEAAEKFAVNEDWLYRNYKKFGLAVRSEADLVTATERLQDHLDR
jgi:hypothetical protein